jgi:hypothetical protein
VRLWGGSKDENTGPPVSCVVLVKARVTPDMASSVHYIFPYRPVAPSELTAIVREVQKYTSLQSGWQDV